MQVDGCQIFFRFGDGDLFGELSDADFVDAVSGGMGVL
jgi:hypothetical protein